MVLVVSLVLVLFFFNDTATTEIYTLSLHDALPIFVALALQGGAAGGRAGDGLLAGGKRAQDRKSTRLNSSHPSISYAVFCLKKKKEKLRIRLAYIHKGSDYGLTRCRCWQLCERTIL